MSDDKLVFEEEENNNDGIEPKDYFEDLKTKISEVELEQLEKNRDFLAKEIQKAHQLGQKNLTHKASFMWEILEKEMILHATGIRKYVHREDVVKLIDNVTPKNSVKIVELENYPRSIPDENLQDIEKARELGVFDVLLVLYTDLTNEEVNTPEQKEFAARNRDPVVFGMFMEDKINLKHDRLYFITDWEDEFCDLTFTKMIEKMSEVGIKNPEKTITVDHNQINSIVSMSKQQVDAIQLGRDYQPENTQKKTFVSKLKSFFGIES
jgi:hypothetical protein